MRIPSLKYIPQYPTIFFLICWVTLTMQMGIFMHDVLPARSYLSCTFLSGADALLLIFPFILLPPKWRLGVFFPILISTIFTISNSLHYYYFTDLIYFPDYADAGAYNKFTFSSGFTAWQATQSALLILGLIPIIFGVTSSKKICSLAFPLWIKWSSALLTILYIFAQQCNLSFIRLNHFEWATLPNQYLNHCELSRMHAYKYKGQNLYFAEQLFNTYFSFDNVTLSPEEEEETKNYISLQHQNLLSLEPLTSLPDSMLSPGIHRYEDAKEVARKNLILIVVESLSSHVITDDFGNLTPMPFLRSLANNDSTLFFSRTRKFTGIGRSNDGNLIYETGLIPLDYKNTLFTYPSANYPSLAKALNRFSSEFIADNPGLLYHHQTNKSFGYTRLFSSWRENIKDEIEDMNLAQKVAPQIPKLPQPFYAKVVTIVMHHPYNSSYHFPPLPAATGKYSGPGEKNYLQRCLATDSALSYFIHSLKKSGIYDKSVIVLASDHEPTNVQLEHDFTDDLAIMILNSGYSGSIDSKARQIDLFTSLLDLFDARSYFWAGSGRSLFRKDYKDSFSEDYHRAINAKLIESRYFDNHPHKFLPK